MNRYRRLSPFDAVAVLLGVGIALWGLAEFSAAAAKIAGGIAVTVAGLVGRRIP